MSISKGAYILRHADLLYITFSLCGSRSIHLLFTRNLSSSTASPHTCCLAFLLFHHLWLVLPLGRALQKVLIPASPPSVPVPPPCHHLHPQREIRPD